MKKLLIILLLGFNSIAFAKNGSNKIFLLPQYINQVISNPPEGSMTDIFKKADTEKIKSLIEKQDQVGLLKYYTQLAFEISEYIYKKEGVSLNEEIKEVPETMIVFGLFYSMRENGIKELPLDTKKESIFYMPDNSFGCFRTIVSSIIGLTSAYAIYQKFVAGEAAATILATLKLALGRAATILTAAFAIYDFGECMGWWYSAPIEYNPDSLDPNKFPRLTKEGFGTVTIEE